MYWHQVLCVVLPRKRETFVAATTTITIRTSITIRNLSAEAGADISHTHHNFKFLDKFLE